MRTYDLALAAEEDLRDIWRYTYDTWGVDQAEKYFDQIEACCEAIGDPSITLQAICDRLEAMRERTPRGRTSWQPSSVRMLLERAEKLRLL